MSAHRMKFPPIPGKTPREQFENLARLLITTPSTALEEKKRRKRRKRAAVVGLLAALLFGGCLPIAATRDAAHLHASPDSWIRADNGAPATKDDSNRCIDLSGLKLASLANVDAKLALFDGCMRDHGFKMK